LTVSVTVSLCVDAFSADVDALSVGISARAKGDASMRPVAPAVSRKRRRDN
jgi:hypothetical protein